MAPPRAFRSVVLPEETGPETTMFLRARTQAARKSAACWLSIPSGDELGERVRFQAEAADGEDHVAVRTDRRDRGGEAGAVGEAGLDQRGDPVEAFPFDVFEQSFEDAQGGAVVGEGDVGDTLDPLAGVFEDPARAVDHPFLRVFVGEHPFGDLAEAEQVVAQSRRICSSCSRSRRRCC